MKKALLLAGLMLASASFATLSANDKVDKKKKKVSAPVQKVELKTPSDTLSYAAGVAITGGLDQYLAQRYNVSPEQMPSFLKGLEEGFAHRSDSTFSAYAAGIAIADQVSKQMLPNVKSQFAGSSAQINEELLLKGFLAALKKDTTFFAQPAAQKYFEAKIKAQKEAKDQANKLSGEQFLAENAKKPGVVTLPSGLQYKVLTKGTGAVPTADDKVKVVYEGRTLDGKVFDSTARHGTESDTFGVSGLIKGWTEALLLMPVGSKWEVYIPQELAYGARGAGENIAPYAALVFTLELKGIEKPKQAEPVKPAAAKKTSPKPASRKNKK